MSRNERGMVTAELAIACLILTGVAGLMISIFGLAMVQVRCIDVAGEIARQTARGDAAAVARVTATAPAGARVQTSRPGSGTVQVTVTAPVRIVPGLPVTAEVSARATTQLEPGVP